MKRLGHGAGVAMVSVIAVAAAGCGARSNPQSAPSERVVIAQIALEFDRDVLAGNWDKASELVAKSDQGVMKNLADAADPATRTKTTGLKIGTITITGTRATAVLLGKTCLLKTGSMPQCIDNTNPSSNDPRFVVNLARERDGWKIVLLRPSGSYSEHTEQFG